LTSIMENTDRNIETTNAPDKNGILAGNDFLTGDTAELEVERLRGELETERDSRLRLAAEYQNYRRRTEQEKASAADEGKRELLAQLLSINDDIELALADLEESPDAVAEGVRMIHRRLLDTFEANSVVGFESAGEKFDPERHEAFDVVASGEHDAGTVHKEMRRGYFWNGRLLRPALVVVNK